MNFGRHELDLPATLMLSAALTVGATAIANGDVNPGQAAHVVEHVLEGDPNASVDWRIGATVPPVVGTLSLREQVQGPETWRPVDTTVTVLILRPWAREFSADPMATLAESAAELAGLNHAVTEAKQHGETLVGVDVQGHASDEDDTADIHGGTNPGLGIANPKNVALAETRAHTAGPIVEADLAAVTGHEVPLTYLPGQEDIEGQAYTDQVMAMADKLGVSAVGLVMDFNTNPHSVPAEARQLLEELVPHRRVDVILRLQKMVAIPTVHPTTSDVKIVPLGLPWLNKTQEQPATIPATVTPKNAAEYPKPGFAETKMKAQQYVPPVQTRQIQPRNHNFSKAAPNHGGRMSRSHGGNRSGKRR